MMKACHRALALVSVYYPLAVLVFLLAPQEMHTPASHRTVNTCLGHIPCLHWHTVFPLLCLLHFLPSFVPWYGEFKEPQHTLQLQDTCMPYEPCFFPSRNNIQLVHNSLASGCRILGCYYTLKISAAYYDSMLTCHWSLGLVPTDTHASCPHCHSFNQWDSLWPSDVHNSIGDNAPLLLLLRTKAFAQWPVRTHLLPLLKGGDCCRSVWKLWV